MTMQEKSTPTKCPTSTCSVPDFLAKASRLRENGLDSKTQEELCSLKLPDSLQPNGLLFFFWKTSRGCYRMTGARRLKPSTPRLLKWGIILNPDEVGGYADFIEEHWIGGRTADCVGLIKGYGWFDPETGKIEYGTNGMPDIGADTMYANAEESGTIDTIPEIPGLAVWHEGHIGIYIGNGQVIHASGTKVGVVQTPIGNSGWTHWLKIPYITYYDSDVMEDPNEQHIWDVLYAKIGNPYGVAGLMGNLYAESGLQPNNLQNSYEESLGYSDSSYTQAVDSGSYTNFTSDSAGYGLAQWTVEDRKTPLLAFANARHCSIADLDMQLTFLCDELETKFPGVLDVLKNAKSVREASDYVLFNFEAPLDQGESVQAQRAANGSVYYSRYGQ